MINETIEKQAVKQIDLINTKQYIKFDTKK